MDTRVILQQGFDIFRLVFIDKQVFSLLSKILYNNHDFIYIYIQMKNSTKVRLEFSNVTGPFSETLIYSFLYHLLPRPVCEACNRIALQ